jgi:hypothetical protein
MCWGQIGGNFFGQTGQGDLQVLRLPSSLDLNADLGFRFVIGQHLQGRRDVRHGGTGQRQQAVAGLNPRLGGRAAGVDVADRHSLLGGGDAQGEHAEERMFVGFELLCQLERHLELLVATFDHQRKTISGIVAAEHVPQLCLADDLFVVGSDNHVAGFQSRGARGRFRLDRSHFGGQRIDVGAFQVQAQDSRLQLLAAFQFLQVRQDIGQRHGESDPGIVPLGPGDFVLALRRQGNQHAQHPAANIDQRPAVVVRRDFRIGLDGFAPDPVAGAQDAHRQIGMRPFERAPTAMVHWPTSISLRGHHRRHGQQFFGVDLQQDQHPCPVAPDDLRCGSSAAGQGDQDRGRHAG